MDFSPMNAELLYTSAPSGLKQGSRGFCTVLSTAGMPINLASKLESLSGYRHVYPSGTPSANKNPVGFSHLRFSLGGRMVSVISRISDYGLDYSQRTNKLAHHIVVDSPLPPSGPAALLLQTGVMRDAWDGRCATVPPPALPIMEVPPRVCREWESMTGDAGWGGVVANTWLRPQPKPLFIVFSEDQAPRLLSLIAESIALLPVRQRWQATFGTYVTNLPPDVDCKVRCVIAGSEEARMASARGSVINLTTPLGPAVDSDATQAAREGLSIGGSAVRTPALPADVETSESEESPSAIPPEYEEFEFDEDKPFGDVSAHSPPDVRYAGTRFKTPSSTTATTQRKAFPYRRVLTAAICLLLSLLGIAGYGIYRNTPRVSVLFERSDLEQKNTEDKSAAEKAAAEKIAAEKAAKEKAAAADKAAAEKAAADKAAADKAAAEKAAAEKAAAEKAAAEKAAAEKAAEEKAIADKSMQLKAEDIQVEVDGFWLSATKQSPRDEGKIEMDVKTPIPIGFYGSKAKGSIQHKNEYQKKELEKAKLKWHWEKAQTNPLNKTVNWVIIGGVDENVITVTTDMEPSAEIRVRVEIQLENGRIITTAPSRSLRIADHIPVRISLNANFLTNRNGYEIDAQDIEMKIDKTMIDAFESKNYQLKPFSQTITSRKKFRNLRDNSDDEQLQVLVSKIEELRSKRQLIVSLLLDLNRDCIAKKENEFCRRLAVASRQDLFAKSTRFELLGQFLQYWQSDTKKIIAQYKLAVLEDGSLRANEKIQLVRMLGDASKIYIDDIPSYLIFWEKGLSPSSKRDAPEKLVEKLIAEIKAYDQLLNHVVENEWVISTKLNAFRVDAKESQDLDKPDELASSSRQVATFGCKTAIHFEEDKEKVEKLNINGMNGPAAAGVLIEPPVTQ
jgi:hypothetical protein